MERLEMQLRFRIEALTTRSRTHLLTRNEANGNAHKDKLTIPFHTQTHLRRRDSDRYRQILKTWRENGAGRDKNGQSALNKQQFQTVLNVLGLFATREQCDRLFEKYDINGDGKLTVGRFSQY